MDLMDFNQSKPEIVERRNLAIRQELEQKVRLEILKNQTRQQQKALENHTRELRQLFDLEQIRKRSIKQMDQLIRIKKRKIAELGKQELARKRQLDEILQKVNSQKQKCALPKQPLLSALPAQSSQLVCQQFYNQPKFKRQRMIVQNVVNSNLSINSTEFENSGWTTTTISPTLTCVIPEMVQSSFSPESTTSCLIPDNTINDIDQCPNSTNGSLVICYTSSTLTLTPTVTTVTSNLFIPETLATTSPLFSTVASNLDNSTPISTTTSNLNPVATSTLSKSFNENLPPISTVTSTSTSKLISSPTSTFPNSTTKSPSIFTATFNLDKLTPTSKLVSSATSTFSKTFSSISSLTFTLPNSSTLTSPPTSNLDKTYSKLDSSSLSRFSTFDNGIENIPVDNLDYDDVEEEVMVNLDDCGTILANNIETLEKNIEDEETSKSIYSSSTNEELIEVNHIGGDDIAPEANVAVEADVLENKPVESTNQIIERLAPESSNIDLGDDFELVDEQFDLVDNQNNTKLTSKTNNSRHQIKSKRRERGNSKLRNNNKRIESNEERQQRLEQCREFYGLRKRRQEEEPRNSQASSELNKVGQNGKLRSNRDIDNRATLKSSGRRSVGGGGCGVETTNQRECRSKQWKLLKIRETPEQRERRLAYMREYTKHRIANETPEERKRRLALQKKYDKQKKANETPEQKDLRLAQQREYDKQRRANETPKKRKHRLATDLERYHRKKRKQ